MRKLMGLLLLSTCAVSACTGGRTRLSQPAGLVAEGWQDVDLKSVCLEVNQSFPELGPGFSLPVEAAARRILSGLGMDVMPAGSECDGTLSFSFQGEALAQDYVCILGDACGHCYSGARISGDATLTAVDRASWMGPFDASFAPPTSISECPKVPEEAPLHSLWPGAMLASLLDLWGTPVLSAALEDPEDGVRLAVVGLLKARGADGVPLLVEALKDRTTSVRLRAALALGQVGAQATEAVPALIEVLDDSDRPVRLAAASALNLITGQDFGQDQATWRKWLSEPSLTPSPFRSWNGVVVMPGARSPEELGSLLQYTIDVGCSDVAAFYQLEMTGAGWTLIESGSPGGIMQRLKFEKGRDTAEVNLFHSSEVSLDATSQMVEVRRCNVQIFLGS